MLELREIDGGFILNYNGLEIVKHTFAAPFLSVGNGKAAYTMFHGNFEIADDLREKLALRNYQLLQQTPRKTEIAFLREGLQPVVVNFSLQNGRLEMQFLEYPEEINRIWLRISALTGEHVYGCGEQFSEFDLRGKRVPLWVSEQGVGRNKKDYITWQADLADKAGGDWYTTYYPQPTFVSTRRYFCHVEDSHYMEFDFRCEDYHELMVWAVPEKIVISRADSLLKVLEDLTGYLGRQPELPNWALHGVWLGVQGGTNVVLNKLKKARKQGLEVAALWAQDWEGKRITPFGKQLFWNWRCCPEMYPDLKETIRELRAENIRFLGYINPFLALEGDLYREASARGYLVKQADGREYHIVITTFPAAMLDLTNPAAREWIKGIIKENLINSGFAGWMADYGEYLPCDAVLFSGEKAASFHNRLPVVWAQINREAVEEAGKAGEVVFFTRAGYAGTARYSTLLWAGDQLVNWSLDDGLPSVIPAALSVGMSGFGICHCDTGGYTSLFGVTRTKELFMRWAELTAFTPIMRTHEGNRPEENWQYDSDEETLLHFARMSRIHSQLAPYIKETIRENTRRGIPVMRPLLLHYETDQACYNLKYQYLLGRDILVAPVLKENINEMEVYLPEDQWVHLWTGKLYQGGSIWIEAKIGHPPVFYRKDSPHAGLIKKTGQN